MNAPVTKLQARLRFELLPLLHSLELLTDATRALRVIELAADASPDLRSHLDRWGARAADPLMKTPAPDAVVCELAGLAVNLARELSDLETKGGAA